HRIEKEKFSVGDDAWRIDIFGEQSIEPISLARFRHALVAAAQDRDTTAPELKGAREFFHHWRFTRSTDSEVSNADDEATERALAENSFPIQIKPELDDPLVDKREGVKHSAQNRSAKATAAAKDDVDPELLQIFKRAPHMISDE
ncbi:MAG: hypothetical protein QOF93_1630, partial [Verrucomicrobiota bacterium]